MHAVRILLIILLGSFVQAQEERSCQIMVPVIVRPEQNKKVLPTTGIFVMRLGDKSIPGTLINRNAGGRHVAILLDGSGSMRKLWPVSQRMATEVVQALDASDEIAYTRFGETFSQSLPASADHTPILQAIGTKVEPYGRTALRDAMAAVLAQPGLLRRDDALILISDGQDNISKWRESALEKELTERQVRFFPIIVADLFDAEEPILFQDVKMINDLVESTGGYAVWPPETRFRFVGRPKRLDEASIKEIALQIRVLTEAIDRPNLVGFRLPQALREQSVKKLHIELTDDTGKKIKGTRLAYPRHSTRCDQLAATPRKPN